MIEKYKQTQRLKEGVWLQIRVFTSFHKQPSLNLEHLRGFETRRYNSKSQTTPQNTTQHNDSFQFQSQHGHGASTRFHGRFHWCFRRRSPFSPLLRRHHSL